MFSTRRDDSGQLLFEASAPDSAAVAYESPVDMVADLGKRYPAERAG